MERAAVHKGGVRAATLERRPDAVAFQYEPDYLAGGGPPVATSLPLTEAPLVTHTAGALPPFFSGLLPEGRRLHLLRTAIKTSADDELSLLLAVGTDAVGDVQVVPEGDPLPDEIHPALLVEDWRNVRFADLLARSVGDPKAVDRVALPGVQDKVSVRMINLPVAQRGERFFLKLDPPEFPHLVVNEMFFLEAARHSGLETTDAQVVHDGEWRVTPAYDLPSSYPYGDVTMALSLNGRTQENIGRGEFLALADAVQVRPRAVETALDALVDAVDGWVGELDRLPFDTGKIRKLRRAIEVRRDRLRRR